MIERVGRVGPEESQTGFSITDEEVLALRHRAAGLDHFAALREAIKQPPTLKDQVEKLIVVADDQYVRCRQERTGDRREAARFEGMGQALRGVLQLIRKGFE